jgi:hypothetical protein
MWLALKIGFGSSSGIGAAVSLIGFETVITLPRWMTILFKK